MIQLLSNTCPACKSGKIFKGLISMNEYCPGCKHHFNREPGYFTGALFINYTFLALTSIPTLVIPMALKVDPVFCGLLAFGQIVLLAPFSLRWSRTLWIQVDFKTDPWSKT